MGPQRSVAREGRDWHGSHGINQDFLKNSRVGRVAWWKWLRSVLKLVMNDIYGSPASALTRRGPTDHAEWDLRLPPQPCR
jgi:hypothetical protein